LKGIPEPYFNGARVSRLKRRRRAGLGNSAGDTAMPERVRLSGCFLHDRKQVFLRRHAAGVRLQSGFDFRLVRFSVTVIQFKRNSAAGKRLVVTRTGDHPTGYCPAGPPQFREHLAGITNLSLILSR
jgi:hypothetical protein